MVGTEDLFGFQIRDSETGTIHNASITYEFSLYHASFTMERASTYTSIVTLK